MFSWCVYPGELGSLLFHCHRVCAWHHSSKNYSSFDKKIFLVLKMGFSISLIIDGVHCSLGFIILLLNISNKYDCHIIELLRVVYEKD